MLVDFLALTDIPDVQKIDDYEGQDWRGREMNAKGWKGRIAGSFRTLK